MSTLREKMKQEMILVGLAESTQGIYLKAVTQLHDYYKGKLLQQLSVQGECQIKCVNSRL